jgi:hypothetical protein
MKTLALNDDEERVLREMLERSVHDLEMEILHTDHHEFRALLKARHGVLRTLLGRLGAAASG